MKTTIEKKTKSGLENRPEPRSTESQRQIDFRRRAANRSLETEKLLALLESETPKFFELAEVVGKWVWIQFRDKQPVAVTRILKGMVGIRIQLPVASPRRGDPDNELSGPPEGKHRRPEVDGYPAEAELILPHVCATSSG